MRQLAAVFLTTLIFLTAMPAVADDTQYWSQNSFHLLEKDRVALSLYLEGRFANDASDLGGVFVGPKLTYQAHPNLGLGLAVKRIDLDGDVVLTAARSDGGGPQIDGRIEFELAPRARLSDRWQFNGRHRAEWIHRETQSDRTRFRHLLRWTRSLRKMDGSDPADTESGHEAPRSGWSHIFFSNEIFHEDGEDLFKVNENRMVPFGARWKMSQRASIDIFYLLHSRKFDGDWDHNHVLGTFLSLKP